MTQDEFLKQYENIKTALDEAEKDTTPFAVVTNDTLSIVGDPNKTEPVKRDYTLDFTFPSNMKIPNGVATPSGIKVTMTFPDVFIVPRKRMDVVRLAVNLLPFFREVDDMGEVSDISDEKINRIVDSLTNEIVNAMYEFVAGVLNIDERLRDYIEPMSIMRTVFQIFIDNPSLANEADTFFGQSAPNQSAGIEAK